MTNTKLMDVLNSADEFLEVLASLLFRESLVLNDDVKQLSAGHKFHDEV